MTTAFMTLCMRHSIALRNQESDFPQAAKEIESGGPRDCDGFQANEEFARGAEKLDGHKKTTIIVTQLNHSIRDLDWSRGRMVTL